MSKNLISFATAIFFAFVSLPAFSDEPNDVPIYASGEVLVQFAPDDNGEYLRGEGKETLVESVCGGTIAKESAFVPGLTLVSIPDGLSVEEAISQFENTPGVLYAQPNYIYHIQSTRPNDEYFTQLWGLDNNGINGGTPDADIDAPEAWDFRTDANNIIVAVIDTGVDYTHLDLAANMWHNPGEIPGNGIDDDHNGYIDDVYGYDFCTCYYSDCREPSTPRDSDPIDDSYLGHGTHIAGIIGADGNNGIGVTGVCWKVKIMAVRAYNYYGAGKTLDSVDSIYYAIMEGAKIINASWGGKTQDIDPNQDIALRNAILSANAAGILFIAAAGNDYQNNDVNLHSPASYNCDNIISVMSTDNLDRRPNWSDWGPNSVDLAAPGLYILSCLNVGNFYDYSSGTSMSAPYVSGASALVWAMNPSLTHLQVKDIILNSVDIIPALENDPYYGRLCLTGGRLNLYNALRQALISKIFKKTDDVNNGDCISPGDEITYTISYSNPNVGDANYYGTLNDVNLIDNLPQELDFVSALGNLIYDSNFRRIYWHIGTVLPGDTNSVTLTVKVNECISGCSVITNSCEIKIGDWTLGTLCEKTPVCCASNPRPNCASDIKMYVENPPDINLIWCKGRFAADVNGQDVYFGTDFDKVSRANSSSPVAKDANDPNVHKGRQISTKWLAKGLIPGVTYYWRVDEVNDYGPDPRIWPSASGDLTDDNMVDLNDLNILCQQWLTDGPEADIFPKNNPDGNVNFRDFAKLADDWLTNGSIVWSFTAGLFIDDFERYTSLSDFGLVWTADAFSSEGDPRSSGYCDTPGGYESTGATVNWDADNKYMIYDYDNNTASNNLFSEARMESGVDGIDWTVGESDILSISYRGLADNDANEIYDRMYVAIIDAANVMGPVVNNLDANAQKQTTWKEWQISFSDLKGSTSLDLTKEVNLIIGFGQRCNPKKDAYGTPGGTGRVWFDNIRLYNQYSTFGLLDDTNIVTDTNSESSGFENEMQDDFPDQEFESGNMDIEGISDIFLLLDGQDWTDIIGLGDYPGQFTVAIECNTPFEPNDVSIEAVNGSLEAVGDGNNNYYFQFETSGEASINLVTNVDMIIDGNSIPANMLIYQLWMYYNADVNIYAIYGIGLEELILLNNDDGQDDDGE